MREAFLRLVQAAACTLLLAALPGPAPAQSVSPPIAAGKNFRAVAVNPATNRIYAANEFANSVTVIDGTTNTVVREVPVGRRPQYIAVNATTNRVYVSNAQDASLSVIDGATFAVTTLVVNGSGPILVDESINRIYVVKMGIADEVAYVNGNDNTWYTIATHSFSPVSISLNPHTRRLYVAHYATGDVRSIDTTSPSDFPPSVSIGVWSKPVAVAVNPATNRIYAVTEDPRGPLVVIDGNSHAPRFLAPAGHAVGGRSLALNPNTNKVYAGFSNEVVVLDGATEAMTFIPAPGAVVAIAVNRTANKAYAITSRGALLAIDGATNAAVTVGIPAGATDIVVNPMTNRAYVAGSGITVIEGNGPVGPPPPPPSPPPPSYGIGVQGLWWGSPAGSESGWGINIAHQGNTIFATWFTYDAQGQPVWYVMSDGARNGTNSYIGDLYRTTGPALNSTGFDPAKVVRTRVGTATFSFDDASVGNVTAVIDGMQLFKKLTRQEFAMPVPTCTIGGAAGASPNYQDLWWKSPAGSESGWGLNIAHQGDILFVTWFTYGGDGRGTWLVGSSVGRTGSNTYAGTLYRTAGPPLNATPWDPSRVTRMPAGQISFAFSDASNAVMTYTLEGATRTLPITRQVFSQPASSCR